MAERLDDPAYRLVGYRQLATMQFYRGDNRAALASLQKAVPIATPPTAGAELPVWMGPGHRRAVI